MRRLMSRRLVANVPARGAVFLTFDLGIIRLHSDHLDLRSRCALQVERRRRRGYRWVLRGEQEHFPHSEYPMSVRGLQAPVSVVATSGIGWTYWKVHAWTRVG